MSIPSHCACWYIAGLAKEKEVDLNCLAVAALRHLSMHQELKRPVVDKAALPPVIRSLQWANDDLRCQAAALMANLSENQVGSRTSPSCMHPLCLVVVQET